MIIGEMTVIEHDVSVCEKYADYEQYACFNSYWLAGKLSNESLQQNYDIDRYVKIECNGKKMYRKCIAHRVVCSQEVSLGCRTRRLLGVKEGEEVNVSSSTWFQYHFHNSDKAVKVAFIMALISFLCTIISTITGLVM